MVQELMRDQRQTPLLQSASVGVEIGVSLSACQRLSTVIRQGDGTTGLPGGRDHPFGSGCMIWCLSGGVN